MKKNHSRFLRITSGLLLTAGLITGNLTSIPATATSQEEEELSQFSSLHRVYDSTDNGYIHYHYEDEEGNPIDLNASESTNLQSVRKASNLPSSYDLRTENIVTSIKDQGVTGTCWAFAAIKSAESNLLKKGIQTVDTLDLSESHLAWYTYHPSTISSDPLYREGFSYSTSSFFGDTSPYNEGGNALFATFVLARWSGLALEESAPFTGDTTWKLQNMIHSMNSQSESIRYQSDYIVTDAICYDNASRDQIKEVLMTNGAMDVSYYYDPRFYNDTYRSYYQEYVRKSQAADESNHSVTIVGWDDEFSKENFDGRYQPSSDGAWLIANSYGDTYGDNGYFWMSYEEPSLVEFYSWIADSADTYDNNYQYDGYGWGNPIINTQSDTTEAANIYTANDDYNQNLTAVGIYTISDDQPYTIRIYRNVTAGKPTSGTLAATLSGTEAFQGYHTIRLNEPILLQAGERFSVVISYQKTNNENGYIPMEGISEQSFSYSLIYTSNAGESFLYDNSTNVWVDTNTSQNRVIKNNVCIKAFTVNTGAATHLSLSRSSVTLGNGETYNLSSILQNDSGQEVSYKSSNTSVATVSPNGKITAKATGSAKITVALTNGIVTDITVNVKKAPKNISITPAKKKKLSKNGSFKIKVSLPSGSASNKITYTSSKPGVVSVSSSGKVTGLKKGKSVITVKTYNNKKAKLTVTVR